ncbi:histidine kinase [Bacillus wiedmannii]|nr:histidine kinase [Bacillus wiedmannii]
MKREPKVKNKGKVVLFLLAAGGVFLVKLGFKIGIIHMIRTWFESAFFLIRNIASCNRGF